ncbi:MAG: AAA family ATPase [Betaproteobacteria bacterium]|nr:AAA family ATPase [Betaproteobacteria bacterium]
MVLRLLGQLRWEPDACPSRALPAVLPAAILLVLARVGQWMPRARIAALFWPESPADAALLNLRVNLHKARRLLDELGIDVPLESDRRSLRWAAPVDPGTGSDSGHTLAAGYELPGFERFESWLRQWRESAAVRSPGAPEAEAASLGDWEASTVAPSLPGFYGRRLELARLRASTARAIVVTGEPGVGKSCLVSAAFEPRHWLRCREGLRQGSFGAVADLIASHPQWLEDLGVYRLDVARLLPEVAPDEPLPPLDALTARVRLFEALARTLERHCTMLAVDDLQWADAATVEWLVMLAHRGRVRWVATARADELSEATHSTLLALESAGTLHSLALQGLDRAALNALLFDRRPDLAADGGLRRTHPWLAALAEYTGGNPFCAIEVMDALTAGDQPQRLQRLPLPERVACMVRGRRERLDSSARAVVDASSLAVGSPPVAQLAAMAGLDTASTLAALEAAEAHGLMEGTVCRHDVVREAIRGAIGRARAAELHRRAARYLAEVGAEPDLIAHHGRQAADREIAWPWVLRAAQRLKQRGERDAAVAAMCEVRDSTRDAALALRAEIMLAQERLFDDLVAGRAALETTLVRAGCLPRGANRQTIEAHALAGLVDNAVFSGDLVRASALSGALRERLPGLANDVLVEAHQVLIEATMRQGDFEAAQVSLQGLRDVGVAPPVVLSFEAQIHWFSGAVREARRAFEQLLERHAEYCHGLTIENDLAVMCLALGDPATAETMARRSLQSWACVAHTEALSSLVLGSTLTSLGRFAEAVECLDRAHDLGRRQGSCLFASEALVRRARLHWCAGQPVEAREALLAARDGIGEVTEPLRASGLALMAVLTAVGVQAAPDAADLLLLLSLCARSRHPLVHARHWRAQAAAAEHRADAAEALAAARRLVATAREAGLLEWLCEAQGLVARLDAGAGATAAGAEAQALAQAQGFGWMVCRLAGGQADG